MTESDLTQHLTVAVAGACTLLAGIGIVAVMRAMRCLRDAGRELELAAEQRDEAAELLLDVSLLLDLARDDLVGDSTIERVIVDAEPVDRYFGPHSR